MGEHGGPVTLAPGHSVAWSEQGPVLLLSPMLQQPPLCIDWFTSECNSVTYLEA